MTSWSGRRPSPPLCDGLRAALLAMVETPGLGRFFGCTPLGPAVWTVFLAAAALATLGAAAAPRLLPPAPLPG